MNGYLKAVDDLLNDKDRQIKELQAEIARLHRAGYFPVEKDLSGRKEDSSWNAVDGAIQTSWRYAIRFDVLCVEFNQLEDERASNIVIPMDFVHRLAKLNYSARKWLFDWTEMLNHPD